MLGSGDVAQILTTEYFHKWRLIKHSAKTVTLCFHLTTHQLEKMKLRIHFNGRLPQPEEQPKYFGVTLDGQRTYLLSSSVLMLHG